MLWLCVGMWEIVAFRSAKGLSSFHFHFTFAERKATIWYLFSGAAKNRPVENWRS